MANERVRKQYTGAAVATTLAADLTAGGTSITLTAGSSYPTTGDPFVISVGRGLATEEKILISARVGNILTVLERGYDGTVGVSHTAGESVYHVLDAYTVDQANQMANVMTTNGDTLYRSATTIARRAIGTAGQAYITQGGIPVWGQVGDAGVSAISPSKLTRVGLEAFTGAQLVSGLEFLTLTESIDTNAFLASPSDTIIIPSGFGGVYLIQVRVQGSTTSWEKNANRSCYIDITGSITRSYPIAEATGGGLLIAGMCAVMLDEGDEVQLAVVDNVSEGGYSCTLEMWQVSE
jgi:hypothetical protein